ncbi:hypothetical protein [Dolichospermum circinale]|uniref:hypothetical protein n=1 Tax=Dolichospermum circinale TaxID=109265 RepID=UPI002330BE71|nr:hypothetical protein [Dolichospermum circinale]MDB9453720.1 hypothetical protein [Dolichospermum circinale CS-541/06]MDB9464579.1 hypothetical protein [Dolichospermum circinale CS-541/04]MDB9549577.1 hypothetical protein [Dolichospermum circinale CS-1031]
MIKEMCDSYGVLRDRYGLLCDSYGVLRDRLLSVKFFCMFIDETHLYNKFS